MIRGRRSRLAVGIGTLDGLHASFKPVLVAQPVELICLRLSGRDSQAVTVMGTV